jgi:hypothetical protein
MFEIIYRCKDCNEVVRTRERDDLTRDVTVFMPWPCRSCIAAGVPVSSVVDLGSGEEVFEEEEDTEEY